MFDGDAGAGKPESESKGAEDTKSEKTEETKDDLDGIEGLGDKGKEAIRKEREAAKAAATRAKDAETKLAELEKERSEREAADQKKKDEDAAAAGKWEELAVKREGELKSATDEVATLKAENDQYKAAMADGLEAQLKALPDKLRKLLEEAVPEDNVLGRWQWLHKPTFQELVKDATAAADPKRGNEGGPKSTGNGKVDDTAARSANATRYT